MKRTVFFLIVYLTAVSIGAQKVSRTYRDVPLGDALRELSAEAGGYSINFIYDELEDFRITAVFKNLSIPEAVRHMIGFYPVRMKESGRDIMVECIHRSGLRYRGQVTDATGHPLPYANIALLSAKDSTLLGGGVTNESGRFVIVCDRRDVVARISYLGYTTTCVNPTGTDLGTIRLRADDIILDKATVKGRRPLFTSTERGLNVDVEGTTLSRFGTAEEMIKHLPLVMGDGTVVGHGTPEIYINNKKVRNTDDLTRLQAGEVKSAKIITEPGAEYGSDVHAVIRLKTVRQQGEGLSGTFYASANQRKGHYEGLNAALNYRFSNGMDLFARTNYTAYKTPVNATGEDRLEASSIWDYRYTAEWLMKQRYLYTDIGWNWEIGEHHSAGLTYTLNLKLRDGIDRTTKNETVVRDGLFADADSSVTTTASKPRPEHAVNLYYAGDIGRWNINFSADVYRNNKRQDMAGIVNHTPAVGSRTIDRSLLMAQKLVVTAPVTKGTLTFGEETSNTNRNSDFRQSGFSADNHMHYRTAIWSLFADYGLQAGKFSLGVGLRWQNEYNHYVENGQTNDGMSPDYHALIPRFSLSYKSGPWRHTLSYKNFRSNPSYSLLTNTISYMGRYELRTGNPYLKPYTENRFSWTSSYKWLRFSAFYFRNKNAHATFQRAYDDANHPGIVFMERRDVPTVQNYGVYVNLSPKIGFWQMNYSAILQFLDYDYRAIGITHVWNRPVAKINLDNTLNLPHDWMVNLYTYVSPYQASGCAKQKATWEQDITVGKKLLKDKSLDVSLSAEDLFKTRYRELTAYGGINFRTKFRQYEDQRRVCISLSWHFNAAKNRYKGTHAGQDEKDRL